MSQRPPSDRSCELSTRARRQSLTRAEQYELEQLLGADPALRLAHRLGVEFDRATVVQPGDEQLIQRAEAAAFAQAAGAPSTGAALGRARAVIVSALGSAALLAAVWFSGALRRGEPMLARTLPPAAAPKASAEPPSAAAQLAITAPPSAAAPPASAAPPSAASVPAASAHLSQPSAAEQNRNLSAAELFHRANLARGSGHFEAARRDYARLLARFPASAEAPLAQISLGKLLMAHGAHAAAEREFQRYLARGDGQLNEEALFNRAQTLHALQRSRDEQSTWRRLLREYPESVYAQQATERLTVLESGSAP